MPLIDSKTGMIKRRYTIAELKDSASLMRGYSLLALTLAGSGHSGGTLSIMDVAAALYLHEVKHDPACASWSDRDRVFWSAGHKAPALYVSLGICGYFNLDEVVSLRKLHSPFQGHPDWLKVNGVETSSGSLGQGLSISVGSALNARLDKKDYRVYCIMGDGEQQEGQVWEAAMEAGHYKLDNLCAIIDYNKLQIDGCVNDVMTIDPLKEKYEAFGWNVLEIDGHNMEQIVQIFQKARELKGNPTLIIARTIKGKGVDFMENTCAWHGKTPSYDQMLESLKKLGVDRKIPVNELVDKAQSFQTAVTTVLEAKMPKFSRDYFWNKNDTMKVEMRATRLGFGDALAEGGADPRVVCLGADISDSIAISQFYKNNLERLERWISIGIAEQSGTGVCAGLAKEGKLPVFGTYGVFASGRNLDQLRTTVCYGNFNVLIAGAHGGVSVGPDGATHQALEELFQMCGLPNMNVEVPCDAMETRRATKHLLFEIKGPKYIRFAREATPIVSDEKTPYVWGKANVIRFRGEKTSFKEAFEHQLASTYQNENEDLAIIACGPSVPESMRAAWILKNEFGIEARVLNVHTVKPLDETAIIDAAYQCGIVVTAEEHQVGGLGNRVARVLGCSEKLYGHPILMGMIGIQDRFGESGAPWELVKEFEVVGEYIAQEAKKLYDIKTQKMF